MDTTGRFSGTPPLSHTPRATCSATSFRWLLHGVRSDAVLAIAICGRPWNAASGNPRRIHARWRYAFRSSPAYQESLRKAATLPASSPLRGTYRRLDRKGTGRMRAFVVTGPFAGAAVVAAHRRSTSIRGAD